MASNNSNETREKTKATRILIPRPVIQSSALNFKANEIARLSLRPTFFFSLSLFLFSLSVRRIDESSEQFVLLAGGKKSRRADSSIYLRRFVRNADTCIPVEELLVRVDKRIGLRVILAFPILLRSKNFKLKFFSFLFSLIYVLLVELDIQQSGRKCFIFLRCGRIESEVRIFRIFGKENITVENDG